MPLQTISFGWMLIFNFILVLSELKLSPERRWLICHVSCPCLYKLADDFLEIKIYGDCTIGCVIFLVCL